MKFTFGFALFLALLCILRRTHVWSVRCLELSMELFIVKIFISRSSCPNELVSKSDNHSGKNQEKESKLMPKTDMKRLRHKCWHAGLEAMHRFVSFDFQFNNHPQQHYHQWHYHETSRFSVSTKIRQCHWPQSHH